MVYSLLQDTWVPTKVTDHEESMIDVTERWGGSNQGCAIWLSGSFHLEGSEAMWPGPRAGALWWWLSGISENFTILWQVTTVHVHPVLDATELAETEIFRNFNSVDSPINCTGAQFCPGGGWADSKPLMTAAFS